MIDKPCWEIKNCDYGPDSKEPCVVVEYDLADGFLGSSNGDKVCFYVRGTKCFDDDEDMKVPEKLATYCMDCEVYQQMVQEYGQEANLFFYIKHLHDKLLETGRIHELPIINNKIF